jgi:hypothetical protein
MEIFLAFHPHGGDRRVYTLESTLLINRLFNDSLSRYALRVSAVFHPGGIVICT